YSSIFIAAPLLTIWKEREPEYRRRTGLEEQGGPEPDGGTPARRRPRRPLGGPALDPGTVALQEATEAAAAQPAPSLGEAPRARFRRRSADDRPSRARRRRRRRRSRPDVVSNGGTETTASCAGVSSS